MKKTALPSSNPAALPLRRTALAVLVAGCFGAAQANPTLPQVVHGQATFSQQGNLFSITNTPNTIINWQSFSIQAGEVTRFVQQNAQSAVLNRISGQDPSQILGALQSNGKVFLINPNGVLFGQDARVDVGGLVASSLNLSNQDFLAGKMQFQAGETAGAVRNAGAIQAGSGGQVLLIAPAVENSGVITAPNGEVILAAGRSVQLADAANPSLQVVLSAPADQAINVGQVIAQGGRIGMFSALLNQRGVLNADSAVVGEQGRIVLKASGKALLEAGSLTSAGNAAGKAGEVTVLGEQVGVLGDARIDASGALGGGTVLLGGDYQGKNAAIANARQVAVGAGASIAADAIDSGNGGKVIVWGDETARVAGSISARGGARSGDGGLVETSGHYLAVDGIRVDTSAARGKRGNWLLDPYDINVVAGSAGSPGDVDEFADAPASGTAVIGASVIAAAQSDVTLQATHRININSAINMANNGVGLKAQAGEAIAVNADITTKGGKVILSANDAEESGTATGLGANVILNGSISSNNGEVRLSGATISGAGTVNVGDGQLSLVSNYTGGNIYLTGTGDQLVGSGAFGQNVTLQADGISFAGRIDFGGAAGNAVLNIKPLTAGRAIHLGDVPGGLLGLDNAELNRIAAATVHIGSATAGDLTVSAPVDLADLSPTGGIRQLNLETGGKLSVDNILAMRQGGGTLTATAGSSLTVGSGGGLYAGRAVELVADQMNLGGAAQSISTEQGGSVALRRHDTGGTIEIGSSAADTAGTLGLSEDELKTINTSTIAIGRDDFAGTLKLQGGLDLRSSAALGQLELRSGGEIELNGALAVGGDLHIAAGTTGDDRSISANGAVHVGGNFVLGGGNWLQNSASLPSFYARGFTVERGSFARFAGGAGDAAQPYRIADIYGLQGVGSLSKTAQYQLAGDIDASGTGNWNQDAGFMPLFDNDDGGFAGVLDGAGHAIRNLTIDATRNSYGMGAGLFSQLQGGTLRKLNLVGGSVTGSSNVGALAGNNIGGSISSVQSSMAVRGSEQVGGLVGRNSGSISDVYVSATVTGDGTNSSFAHANLGGVIGWSEAGSSAARLIFDGVVNGNGFDASSVGAVVGRADPGAAVGPAYFNVERAGTDNNSGVAIGLSTAQMRLQTSFGGFDFGSAGSAWRIYDGYTTPMLRAFLTPLQVNASGTASQVYNGQDAVFNGSLSYVGLIDGDLGVNGSAGYAGARNVGSYALGGLWSTKYDITYAGTTSLSITPRMLSVTVGGSKVYDGTQDFGNASYTLGNLVNGDSVTASGSARFLDKDAGTGKAVSASGISLAGNELGNYEVASSASGTADISRASLNLINVSAGSKVYDGNRDATLSGALQGVIAGDQVSLSGATGQFADKNAGTGKQVSYHVGAGNLAGQDAGNYVLDTSSGYVLADITPRLLHLSFTGINKVYDGSKDAAVQFGDDRIAGDVLTASASAVFGDKNAGSGKTVTVANAALSGSDAGNYVLGNTGGQTTADIGQRVLDLSFTGINKIYDGSTAASVGIVDNRVAGDVLTASASAVFGDKNAGTGKTVTVANAALSGSDAGNYVLGNTGGQTTADIAQRVLDLSFTGINKVYDGSNAASVNIVDNRVAGDVLTASASAAFGDKNASSGKTVTVANAALSGSDAGNYVLGNTGGQTTADIAQRVLDLNFTGINKIYDGSNAASVNIVDNRVAGDVLTATASAVFGDKNAGTGKTVTVANAALSGSDAGNYVLGNTGGQTTADIAQRVLDLSFTGINKVYDGSNAASVNIVDNRVAGDVLTASASAAFGDKNAGSGKTVTVANAALSGSDAGNYVLGNTGGQTTADIGQRVLDLRFTGINKTYDGSNAASVNIIDNRVAGDVLTASASAVFGDKNAGSGKTVTVANAALSGSDAGNYVLGNTGGQTTADIAQRVLDLSFTGINKVYDGSNAASVNIIDNRVAGDVLTATASAVFGDKNAGSGKTVTVANAALSGNDAGNYVLGNTGGQTTADIGQRVLDLRFTGINKTYDGSNAASVNIIDNRVAGDVLTASASAAFGDKNAGSGKTVTVANAALSGNDAGNYVLGNTGGQTTADIGQRVLDLRFTGINKTYDGSNAASVNIIDNRVAGDVLTATASAVFGDKNAGSGKTVTVANAALSGNDAGNYVLGNTGGQTTADIGQRVLDLRFTGINKTYDGSNAASVNIIDNRVAGDVLTATASAAFGDKNAGSGKTVTVANAALSGSDAGNYILSSTGGSTVADIARATLVLGDLRAADKVYDGSVAASVSASVNGVIGQDAVSLSGGTGTFADRNAGSGKTVYVSGFGLAGSDAGNYVLNTTGGVTQASIAQRALSTWIGGSGGLWSDAANWADGIAPSGNNVLAADLAGSAGTVVYNAAAGETTLNSLNTRGGLQISGGSLTLLNSLELAGASGLAIDGGSLLVHGTLSVGRYEQGGGLLGGSGNLLVANSFNQLGGAIALGGSVSINQAAGNLRIAGLSANAVSLNAASGTISQSGAIVAGSLGTRSQSGVVLNDGGNRIGSFTADNTGAGDIALTNSSRPGQLVLGSLATSAGNITIDNQGGIESHAIDAKGGNVSLVAHSPISVQGQISGNDIRIDASSEVVLGDGARLDAARNIAITAGSDMTLDGKAAVNAGNKLAMTAGRSVFMNGTSTMDVQAAGDMRVLAQNGDLTALADVRINTRGAPLSLLAPNGKVTVPDSVIVRQPGTTPVVPASLRDAASNYLAAVTEQYTPGNSGGSSGGGDALLVSAKPEEQSNGGKHGIQKNYCN